MATKLRLDPELAAVVDRARRRADETGELGRGPLRPSASTLPADLGEIILELLRDGTYAEAVARVVAEDPELADQ